MSDESAEWTDWIEHDGKGLPVPKGTVVLAIFENDPGEFVGPIVGIAGSARGYAWDWSWWRCVPPEGGGRVSRITRYRIRKPRALRDLIALVENLPAPVRLPEGVE